MYMWLSNLGRSQHQVGCALRDDAAAGTAIGEVPGGSIPKPGQPAPKKEKKIKEKTPKQLLDQAWGVSYTNSKFQSHPHAPRSAF